MEVVTPQYGSKQDLEAVLELYATGEVVPIVSSHRLEEINEVLDKLRSGSVLGRVV
ncbi:hypothetical protein H0H93_012221, partial [Arthromyces matolae]